MTYFQIYLLALAAILIMMSVLWIISIPLKNVSIVDLFWGLGFVMVSFIYFFQTDGSGIRKILLLAMVAIWGLRLSGYLVWRNAGKGEDPRYRKFRQDYGEHRYWWLSFFQTFLLQGILMWLISAPLLGAMYYNTGNVLNALDYAGAFVWLIGLIFESGGDIQLARFKSDPANRGKVLNTGFWHYTRHPNYFGDAAVWCGYALVCIAAGSYIPVLGSVIMIALIIKVSGVALLEKSLLVTKPGYKDYIEKTSAFIPWIPKK
jgi:steroid 5-alpha reductase family enzyme